MRVLVACEFSGVVRDAFRAGGHDAWSCDLLPSEGRQISHWYPEHYGKGHQLENKQFHYQCDIKLILPGGRIYHTMALEDQAMNWDLMIAHPPCTHLAVSGARWFKEKQKEQAEALEFVKYLLDAPIPRIALENPVSVISTRIRSPEQVIQPYWFGHPEFKKTCLWLKNLPPLIPTNLLPLPERDTDEWKRWSKVHRAAPRPDRWKERSRTYTGIAAAMADQWGRILEQTA